MVHGGSSVSLSLSVLYCLTDWSVVMDLFGRWMGVVGVVEMVECACACMFMVVDLVAVIIGVSGVVVIVVVVVVVVMVTVVMLWWW